MSEAAEAGGALASPGRATDAGRTAGIVLRAACEDDLPLIVTLIHELAEYERLADMCVANEDTVRETIFGPDPAAQVVLAFWEGAPAGYALFFRNYSTFLSRPGLYLEDLYVRPPLRKRGIGLALLRYLAQHAVERGYPRLEWSVLRWNRLAIDFYDRIGAEPLEGWMTYRLSGRALEELAVR